MIREGYDAMTEIGDRSFASTVAGLATHISASIRTTRRGALGRSRATHRPATTWYPRPAAGQFRRGCSRGVQTARRRSRWPVRQWRSWPRPTTSTSTPARSSIWPTCSRRPARLPKPWPRLGRRALYEQKGATFFVEADPATDRRVGLLMAYPGRLCARCGNENPAEARFCFSCGAALEASAPAAETRKTVTVLFCDLVGSTALGERLDPETLRGLLGRSFDRVSAIVEGHGGVVEKFIGDAAMAVRHPARARGRRAARGACRGGDPRSAGSGSRRRGRSDGRVADRDRDRRGGGG